MKVLFAYLLRTMTSTTDIGAYFGESVEAKGEREKTLKKVRERKSPPCIGNS